MVLNENVSAVVVITDYRCCRRSFATSLQERAGLGFAGSGD